MEKSRKESVLSLNAKINLAKVIISDALENFTRPTIVWSGGKDSTVVLNLVKEVTDDQEKKLPPALFIDHGDHYPETLDLLDKVSQEWGFRIITARNDNVLNNINKGKIKLSALSEENIAEAKRIDFHGELFEYSLETEIGNHLLKTVAMNNIISRYRFDALFTGVRWDENLARSLEVFISPRDNPEHVRVQPVLPFLEKDIWRYMFDKELPIHPKYREGYRSIDGIHDSTKTSEIPAWEQDLKFTEERAGRSQDKEGMMERLRQNGYM